MVKQSIIIDMLIITYLQTVDLLVSGVQLAFEIPPSPSRCYWTYTTPIPTNHGTDETPVYYHHSGYPYTLRLTRPVTPFSFSMLLYDIHNSSKVSDTASCIVTKGVIKVLESHIASTPIQRKS